MLVCFSNTELLLHAKKLPKDGWYYSNKDKCVEEVRKQGGVKLVDGFVKKSHVSLYSDIEEGNKSIINNKCTLVTDS